MITYRQLLRMIEDFSEAQLDQPVTVYSTELGKYIPLSENFPIVELADDDDEFPGNKYLVI